MCVLRGQFIGTGSLFVDCRDWPQVVRFTSKHLYPWSHLAGLHFLFLRQALSVNMKLDSVMLGEQKPSGPRLPSSHQGWGYRLTLPAQLLAWVLGIWIHIIMSVGHPLYWLSILPSPDYFCYLGWFYTLSSSNSPASASWEYGLLAAPISLAFKPQQ